MENFCLKKLENNKERRKDDWPKGKGNPRLHLRRITRVWLGYAGLTATPCPRKDSCKVGTVGQLL